jgi:acyl-CoA synthetase (AMP-forming)/AMP-acid ligase II
MGSGSGDGGRAARDALRSGWRQAGWYPNLTVGEALRKGAEDHPDARLTFAPVDGEPTTVTLAELRAAASHQASALHALGVRPGDAVVVQAAADLEGTTAMVALWSLGAVVVPLVAAASSDERAHVVREVEARTIVVTPAWRGGDLAASVTASQDELGIERIVVLGEEQTSPGGLPELTRPDPWDVACVLYTSGSTAAPKGVQHTHETLLFGLDFVPADSTTRSLLTFPAGHVAALLGLLRPLTVGGVTVVMDRWSARAAAALIEEHRLTTSAGTPFFLATLLDEGERSGRDLSSLGRFLCGAAAVPPALVARAEAAGIVTWRTYGSTEHPAIAGGGPTDPPEKRQHTDGKVAPGNEVRLVDEHGADVPLGEEGEVISRGPKQFVGYRDPSLDEAAFLDGTWFRTGDLARFDPDGHLIITDRVKDIVIRGGENISAREVEEVLADAPGVVEIAICAASDPTWGEVVCAVVVVDATAPPTLDGLQAHARDRGLSAHKLPARMVITDELPRTPAGKVRKRDLRPLLG